MRIKDTSNKIFNELIGNFEKLDFSLNRGKSEFKRNVNNCTQIFDLFFHKKANSIIIKPELRIKVHAIEDIYKSITNIKERPYLTLGNHLFEILRYIDNGTEIDDSNEEIKDWLIEDENDINKIIEVIPTYLKDTIIPYFNENSSISRVDELLNKYPTEISIHNPLYPLRANIAIISAKLNNNSSLNNLVEIYEHELQDAEISYKEEFYKIKHVLKLST